MANTSDKKNEIQKVNIELVEYDCDVTKFFHALEKAFDDVALFVKFLIEIMFYGGITFVGDANNGTMTGKIVANLSGIESFICKNFFARQLSKQAGKSRQRAPLRNIHKIPLSTTLGLSGGSPLLFLGGKKNSIFFH